MQALTRRPWAFVFGAAAVFTVASLYVVPVYQDAHSGELRTVQGCASSEDVWVTLVLPLLIVLPALFAAATGVLAPKPPIWARVMLAFGVLAYGGVALLAAILIAMEGILISFLSSSTNRSDSLLVNGLAWAVGLFWCLVGVAGLISVFAPWGAQPKDSSDIPT